MKIVGVIPARAGSKGIPGKNIQIIGGLPLIAWSINALNESKYIEHTYVSSDSENILNIASTFGASLIERPEEFSQDQSSTEDFLNHFILYLESKQIYPDIIVYLQCTSPYSTSAHIEKILKILIANPNLGCAFSALEDHSFLWSVDANGDGYGLNHEAYSQRERRQDLKRQYKETGAIYAFRTEKYKSTKNRFCGKAVPVTIENSIPFEIDTPFDLLMMRYLEPLYGAAKLKKPIEKCKALVVDFDGVLTNDKVMIDDSGRETVECSRADGLGTEILKKLGIKILILTREENNVVLKRAEKMKVEINHGVKNKVEILKEWTTKNLLERSEIAYIGNDINDLECLMWVGFPFAPSDCNQALIEAGIPRLQNKGGEGVIREFANLLTQKNY